MSAHFSVGSILLPLLALTAPCALAQGAPSAPVPEIATTAPGSAQPDATTTVAPTTVTAAPAAPQTTAPIPAASEHEALDPLEEPSAEPQRIPADWPLPERLRDASEAALKFLHDGGPSIWAIAALSVMTLALILWKFWRLALIGAWSRGKAIQAIVAYEQGHADRALTIVQGRMGIRSKVVTAALEALDRLPEDRAREETARVAKLHLGSAATGLGALELIATIAPLLGLLGTVLGMIAAFQALQAAGSKADPALLAGGIWEALLTTAAGMAVAIPASAALTWFEAVIGRMRRDIEDSATRLFIAASPDKPTQAAE
ncbi:MotA/TolQ/ExbB proton channel family protein [Phaeobacter sp. PT47_59]|uniref:MotA/TolQ/ExbB proton channel family protein n=1 Tax=Phaeobacter sp. PT47_59 TaxID=3029979 RepID=UPI0023806837|nr:MotA/TolQ/ExbB proton channel family protein [Phaeobacter sp. PT47_59]MDE4172534.1 MotA/TolQ/ExbB proton channel family protein [Phaeobacter sp. PT47_59]